MTDTLRKPESIKTINLGNSEYELPPLDLNVLDAIEQEFDCSVSELGEALQKRQAGSLKRLLYVLLSKKYPDITKEYIGENISIANLEEISNQLAEAMSGE